jgi:hypothetical protein
MILTDHPVQEETRFAIILLDHPAASWLAHRRRAGVDVGFKLASAALEAVRPSGRMV